MVLVEDHIHISYNTLTDLATNPLNPYYIHGNGSPSQPLVSPLLFGPNYNTWSRAMKLALMAKNMMGFVDFAFITSAFKSSV